VALFGALLVGVSSCDIDELLEVQDPDIVLPANLNTPTGLATLRAGAIGDFAFAYTGNGGGTEGIVLMTGMFTDEYYHSGTFTTRREFDRRDVEDDNGTATGVFRNLQRARQSLETAAGAIQDASTGADERIGELLGLAAVTYNLFGEAYCSGVPFSNLDESGNLVPGTPNTTEEVFQLAVTAADAAAAGADGNSAYTHLAALQKGRALLNLGQYAQAATAVEAVPTDYAFQTTHSIDNGQENGIYAFNAVFERWSLANLEGGNGLAYRDLNDPRVPWADAGHNGFDEVTPLYIMEKFNGRDAPADVATGTEARLIEAEAALQAGDVTTMLNKINEVRALFALAPVADPGTAQGREDLLFNERALTLFATSHRLGDLRRLIRQYGRTESQVFPVGPYHKPSFPAYGTDVNFPVPFDEENNENFTGCLNRGA
jgi:hypothetical protein